MFYINFRRIVIPSLILNHIIKGLKILRSILENFLDKIFIVFTLPSGFSTRKVSFYFFLFVSLVSTLAFCFIGVDKVVG
jgi:hypothetical protein